MTIVTGNEYFMPQPYQSSSSQSPTAAQIATLKRPFPGGSKSWKSVDPATPLGSVPGVNLRRLRTKLSRLDLTQADREVAALKEQFRKEDLALASEGRHDEIALRNRRLMGLRDGARTRLVGYGGVRFE